MLILGIATLAGALFAGATATSQRTHPLEPTSDTWVMRLVTTYSPNANQDDASALLKAVAQQLNVVARRLDHAVWDYRRLA